MFQPILESASPDQYLAEITLYSAFAFQKYSGLKIKPTPQLSSDRTYGRPQAEPIGTPQSHQV